MQRAQSRINQATLEKQVGMERTCTVGDQPGEGRLDALLCSCNARSRTPLVGPAQGGDHLARHQERRQKNSGPYSQKRFSALFLRHASQVSVEPQFNACRIFNTHRASFLPVSSCCHIRSTCHPRFFKVRVTNRSRSLLRSSFFSQNARLVAGWDACFGQPCQKQPSTNIARRRSRKTKSGLPNSLRWRRQPVMQCCRRSFASASSVLRFPRARIRDIICERFALRYMSVISRDDAT